MRKIWPSEDNCSKLVRNSHNTFLLCETRTTPSPCAKFAQQPSANSPLFLPTPHEIFSFVIFDVNSFLIPVISQSQALLCKDYKRDGNHLSKQLMYILHLVKYRDLFCFLFLSTIFVFLEAKQPLRMFSQRMRG